jgi:hypothetical protein
MGMLLDRRGDDTYRANSLSQGGAAMQGVAWLLDLEGTDHYNAPANRTQGESTGNSYHYHRTGCVSWSLFIDAGGTPDFYTSSRENGTGMATGKEDEKQPGNSRLHGIFLDTEDHTDVGL